MNPLSETSQSGLRVQRLRPTFAGEVLNVDLKQLGDPVLFKEIRYLWGEHQVLVFRNQSLEEEDLVAISRRFGELEIHVRKEFLSPDNPEVLYVSNIEKDGKPIGVLSQNEVGWHYDQIYLPRPAVGSLLYGVQLPPDGGATSFADMIAAYEHLPADIKSKIEDKRAIQSYEAFNKVYSVPTDKEQKKRTQDIDHPMVRTHPITGRKSLYICPGMTTRIIGMDKSESEKLLEFLFDWSVRDEFVYTHEWTLGDAILWDNASTMHRREPFDQNQQRLMKRTTILPPKEIAVPF